MAICAVGLDIIGPMLEAAGKVKFIIVAIDYFIKWAEVLPLAMIFEPKIRAFVWQNIIYRFKTPKVIITNHR